MASLTHESLFLFPYGATDRDCGHTPRLSRSLYVVRAIRASAVIGRRRTSLRQTCGLQTMLTPVASFSALARLRRPVAACPSALPVLSRLLACRLARRSESAYHTFKFQLLGVLHLSSLSSLFVRNGCHRFYQRATRIHSWFSLS